ncbi:MAG: hypothetical protein HOJ35_06360 [Bdellovibrionales bacterium]|jgi:hypothetical protein|nr:hypothetical protein [Bdellovibrionales bacterium]
MKKFLFLVIFILPVISYGKKISYPFDKTEIVLLRHKKLLSKKQLELVIQCEKDKTQYIAECSSDLLLSIRSKRKNATNFIDSKLGTFPRNKIHKLTHHVIRGYNYKFDATTLLLTTTFGLALGYSLGETVTAICLGVVGLSIDIAKLPIALPITIGSKIHRVLQIKVMKKRYYALHQNRKYKITRIKSKHLFNYLTMNAYEWVSQFSK